MSPQVPSQGNPEFSVEALRFCYYGEHFSSKSERNSISILQNKESPVVFVKYINEQREIRDCISAELFDQLFNAIHEKSPHVQMRTVLSDALPPLQRVMNIHIRQFRKLL